MPQARRRWRSTIAHLVTKTAPAARLVGLGPRAAALALADLSHATVIVVEGEIDPAMGERLLQIVRDNPHAHLKHVVIGGDPDVVRPMLRACQPRLSMRRAVQVFHLGEDGEVWAGPASRADSPVGLALAAATKDNAPPEPADIAALLEPEAPRDPQEQARAQAGHAFLDHMRDTKPRVVWFLLGVIAVVFGLEELWGGSEFLPTLVRMGANTPASLIDEPWRLASSTLLHAGLAHAAINGVVLVALGGFVERILGGSRLLILLALAGLGGSVASALLGSASFSVGASGAIWGVLAAAGSLALRPGDIIPAAVVPSLRRAAVINLVINLTASFLPGVDLWAHLGGGLVGAALVLSGAMTRGLPGVHNAGAQARPAPALRLRLGATAAAAVILAGLATAVALGRPWTLTAQPTLRSHTVGGLSITVPAALGPPQTLDHYGLPAYAFGDIYRDPFTLMVVQMPLQLDETQRAQAQAQMVSEGPPPPSDAKVVHAWGPAEVGEGAYRAEYVFANGLRQQTWHQVQPTRRVRVDTTWWADAPAAQRLAATRVLESVAAPP